MSTALIPQTVSVQRLFGVAVTLKISFAAAGYLLDSPVWLGTVAPLSVMVTYMLVGYHRRDTDVSEERFADSCYYLGFIFTIASIIICLFDLPKMTPGRGMYLIAMRFGAAMVSTVLGMIVRVYLVGFKKDAAEALKDVESALITATRAFTVQLHDTMRSMQQFEAQIMDASKASVAGVQLQVEALGRNFSDALNRFYDQVNSENKTAFDQTLNEVRTATGRLAASVETYSSGMRNHVQAIEAKVTAFSDAVTARLSSTTFPDDFFSSRLEAPVHQLAQEAMALGQSISSVAAHVQASSTGLAEVLDSLKSRADGAKATMDSVVALSDQHLRLANNADLQLKALSTLAGTLEKLEGSLRLTTDSVRANSIASTDLQRQIGTLTHESSAERRELQQAIGGIAKSLDQTVLRAGEVVERIDSHGGSLREEVAEALSELRNSSRQGERIAEKLSACVQDLPKLIASSEGNSSRMQSAVDRLEELAHASAAAVQASSESTRHVRDLYAAIGEHSRGLAAANQGLSEVNEGTANAVAKLLHIAPEQQGPIDADARQSLTAASVEQLPLPTELQRPLS
jgi:hypothetical protein